MSKKTNKLPSEVLADRLEGLGWKIVENVEASEFEVKDLELVSFLKDGEKSIDGEELRRRAVSLKANFGLEDAKHILDHRAEIPVEFRGKYILFPGTLFDCLHIACMRWEDGGWTFGFIPTGFVFNFVEEDSLVRCKNANHSKV